MNRFVKLAIALPLVIGGAILWDKANRDGPSEWVTKTEDRPLVEKSETTFWNNSEAILAISCSNKQFVWTFGFKKAPKREWSISTTQLVLQFDEGNTVDYPVTLVKTDAGAVWAGPTEEVSDVLARRILTAQSHVNVGFKTMGEIPLSVRVNVTNPSDRKVMAKALANCV